MTTTKLAVLDSVRAAILFARAAVPRTAGVLVMVMLLNVAADVTGRSLAGYAVAIVGVLASLMANGALLRQAFVDEHPGDPEFRAGPQGFQFAKPEWRLLGAVMLLVFFVFLAVLFLLLAAFILTIALVVSVHGQMTVPTPGAKLSPDVEMMLSVLILVFAVALLWAAVRICLYPAATVAEKHVRVFSTWKMTAGQWWRLFAAVLLAALPALVLAGLLSASEAYPALQIGFAVLSAAVNAFVELPLFAGLYAHIYKVLRGSGTYVVPTNAPGGLPRTGLAGPWG